MKPVIKKEISNVMGCFSSLFFLLIDKLKIILPKIKVIMPITKASINVWQFKIQLKLFIYIKGEKFIN